MSTPEYSTHEQALTLGSMGYKIIPVPRGEKFPKGIKEWQKQATSDSTQIEKWWGGGSTAGIGWAMGRQPNGSFLVAVDVDVADGKQGRQQMQELIREHGLELAVKGTITQRTGSGGYHFIFLCPDGFEPTNGRLAEHIDIRGEGGFIVIAPSIHPNGTPYAWATSPFEADPKVLPPPFVEILTPEPASPPSPKPQPIIDVPYRGTDDDSPADWIRRNMRIGDMLAASGWTYMESSGEDHSWCRPGKSPKDGHSAIVHGDAPMVIWSTSAPMEFWRAGRESSDGGRVLSPLEVYAAINHGGDVRRASSHIRKTMMPKVRPLANSQDYGTEKQPPVPTVEGEDLNLPDDFWEARPVLAQIRQAAWSRSCSPDAVLAGVLARYSASLPPQVKLPDDGTLDIFVVVQGHSGSGKSKAGKTARALYPADNIKGVMMDRNVGSGEGLAEAFFEWVNEDGEVCSSSTKGARKVRTKHGLHFATDEGAALQASAGRMNSILIPAMCAAWMGESLGQLLADPTKSRMIEPMTVRVSAEIRIQTAHGWKLFQEEFSSTGLSQRMICLPAVDPKVYANYKAGQPRPQWPGELELPRPAIIGGETVLSYSDEILDHLAEEQAQVHNPAWVGDPLDTHRTLSALKIAAILALWESRLKITQSDFNIALRVLLTHVANRELLRATQIQAKKIAHETKVTAAVNQEVAIANAKEAEMLGKTVTFLRDKIRAGDFPSRRVLSVPRRAHYEEAKSMLQAEGIWPE